MPRGLGVRSGASLEVVVVVVEEGLVRKVSGAFMEQDCKTPG